MTQITSQIACIYKKSGKEWLKKSIFKRLQKTHRDSADVTSHGISFQTRAAAIGKARSLTVDNHVRQTISDDDDAERRHFEVEDPRTGGNGQRGGAVSCKTLNLRTESLCWILSEDFSQRSRWRSGETELYFDDENTSLAAKSINNGAVELRGGQL